MVVRDSYSYILKLILLFGGYFLTAKLGLSLGAVHDFATLVWPPTGIALAAVLIFGFRLWPAITLAAFLVNLTTGAPALVALVIGIGNTLEALLGAYLLKRFVGFKQNLERLKDVLGLVVLAGFISTAVAASIGVTSLLLGGSLNSSAYGETWSAWWIGDILGNLVVAPFILVWWAKPKIHFSRREWLEPAILAAILIAASIYIFRGIPTGEVKPFRFAYVLFPVLIWVALRFGQRLSVSAIAVVSLIAIVGTNSGKGPFISDSLSHSLLLLQSFIGISAITFMIMSAVVSEKETTLKRQSRLIQRASKLTRQRIRLIALSKSKDEFAAIASHQLRTPATAVKQYLGLLLQGYTEPLTESQRDFLEKAYENNERQLHIIDSMLQVVRLDLDKVKLNYKREDVSKIVEAAIQGLKKNFTTRKQKVEVKVPKRPTRAMVDKQQLTTALENLLENASNYSPSRTKIIVSVKKRENVGVIIIISDEGVGINQKDYPRLFQKFSRIPNPLSIEAGGTGLGLYLAQKIIQLHGGRIDVSSTVKKGTSFTINLPL